MSAGGELCFKILYLILIEGTVVNKDKEYEIGTGKRQIKSFQTQKILLQKSTFKT